MPKRSRDTQEDHLGGFNLTYQNGRGRTDL